MPLDRYPQSDPLPFHDISQEMYEDYLRQSPEPYTTLQGRIGAFAIARHFVYQNFWTDQMAHADFRPLPEGMPISYGMCVTASCTLHDELTKHFRDERFILHSGRVRERVWGHEKVIIPSHVWITQVGGYLDEHTIIDITADQSLRLPPVVVATADNLADHGLVYQSYISFATPQELLESFQRREPHIRQRIGYLALAMEGLYSYAKKMQALHNKVNAIQGSEFLTEEDINLVEKYIRYLTEQKEFAQRRPIWP